MRRSGQPTAPNNPVRRANPKFTFPINLRYRACKALLRGRCPRIEGTFPADRGVAAPGECSQGKMDFGLRKFLQYAFDLVVNQSA